MAPAAEKKDHAVLFRVSGRMIAWWVIPFPLIAFVSCILISVIFHFEGSTYTHCRVRNYLPSISAAIGGFTPQRYIWRVCICLHSAPRIMLAVMFYNYYTSFQVSYKPSLYKFLAGFASFLHILENLALVLLTYVSSTENYSVHENSFILFIVFAQVYMLLTCILYKWYHFNKSWTATERKSFRLKKWFFLMNVFSLIAAVYFFIRHGRYCEPGMYSIFAMCEYSVVLLNIAFHATASVDLGHGLLMFSLPTTKEE